MCIGSSSRFSTEKCSLPGPRHARLLRNDNSASAAPPNPVGRPAASDSSESEWLEECGLESERDEKNCGPVSERLEECGPESERLEECGPESERLEECGPESERLEEDCEPDGRGRIVATGSSCGICDWRREWKEQIEHRDGASPGRMVLRRT